MKKILWIVILLLLIYYKPVGEDWKEIQLESGVSISKQRNSPASATVKLPYNKTLERSTDGYLLIQIFYNGTCRFDGHVQSADVGKKDIACSCVDWLWDLGKTHRSFEQTGNGLNPGKAFNYAFDQNLGFGVGAGAGGTDIFAELYDDIYTTPWLPGYNATTGVVMSDITYDDFFITNDNATGIDFMDFLAEASYAGDKYKFFFWFENIDGVKRLYFQPDGWGKLWKLASEYTFSLKKTYEDIYNKILVWGGNRIGHYPLNDDYWTETNLDGWTTEGSIDPTTIDFINTDTSPMVVDPIKKGFQALRLTVDIAGNYGMAKRSLANTLSYNLEKFRSVSFWCAASDTSAMSCYFYIKDSVGRQAQKYLTPIMIADNTWYSVNITTKTGGGGPNEWDSIVPGFDWTDIDGLWFIFGGDPGIFSLYADNLFIDVAPIRAGNNSTASGYDDASAVAYGLRETKPIHMPHFNTVAKCNAYAATLLQHYKDPRYEVQASYNCFMPFALNDALQVPIGNVDHDLAIDSIKWDFEDDGITTSIVAGNHRIALDEFLKKVTTEARQSIVYTYSVTREYGPY